MGLQYLFSKLQTRDFSILNQLNLTWDKILGPYYIPPRLSNNNERSLLLFIWQYNFIKKHSFVPKWAEIR